VLLRELRVSIHIPGLFPRTVAQYRWLDWLSLLQVSPNPAKTDSNNVLPFFYAGHVSVSRCLAMMDLAQYGHS
jgi:hypothetical protein